MGVEPAAVSSYRRRLVDTAMIEAPSYGMVSFAIPYMREYLLGHSRDKCPVHPRFQSDPSSQLPVAKM